MNEYEKLVQAEKCCHTIEVREKATGKEGVANTCKHGVQVFYGAHDGSDDKTVSPEVFSRDFKITAEIASRGANMKPEDYTIEYCPFCDQEVVIRSHGITACPSCGKPLAPCSVCSLAFTGCYADCNPDENTETGCPYGCTGGAEDEFKPITNPPMTAEEIAFAEANC